MLNNYDYTLQYMHCQRKRLDKKSKKIAKTIVFYALNVQTGISLDII